MFFEKADKIKELQDRLNAWEKLAQRFYMLSTVEAYPITPLSYMEILLKFIEKQEAKEKDDSEREKVEAIVRDLLEKGAAVEEKVALIIGKPPMDYYDRLFTLDDRSFIGEMKKKSRETKGGEPISALIALVLMGVNAKSNDPYVLDSKTRKKGVGFDVFRKGSK